MTAAALGAVAAQGARSVLIFRAEVVVGLVSAAARVVLVVLVWRAVYGDRGAVAGIDQRVAVGYAVLGALFNVVLQPWQFSALTTRIRSGTVIFDMMRPVGLVSMSLAQQVGATVAGLPKAIIGLVVGLLLGALVAPSGPTTVAFVLSTALGVANALLCNLLMSMVAFWTLEVSGAMILYRMAAAFCSGSLIPLWFMPHALATTLRFLPFSAQVFTPMSIYFDDALGAHTVVDLAIQAGWVALLVGVVAMVQRRAVRRVVVFGG